MSKITVQGYISVYHRSAIIIIFYNVLFHLSIPFYTIVKLLSIIFL